MRDDGEPWGKSHQHRPMRAAVKAAGLPSETVFYSLRHYYISRALLAGMNAQVIAENCGTSVRMIEKHYGKFTRADRRRMLDLVQL
jgi:integrase